MNTPPPAAHVRSLRSQIASISEKLRSLDASTKELDRLIREETTSLRAPNTIQSPSGKLPPEVLSYIFKLAAPQPVFFSRSDEFPRVVKTRFPLNLCAVSSHWREVAHSTPSLWTSASFFSEGTTGKKSDPCLLILYLENSKNLPLHLTFSYHGREDISDRLVDKFVDPILIANLPRVKTLVLCNTLPDSQWYSHFDRLTAVTDLVLEHFPSYTDSVEVLHLNRCRSLRRVSIRVFAPDSKALYRLPFFITVLDLGFLPIDTAVKLLLRCPNIVEFYLDLPRAPSRVLDGSLTASWFRTPVTFEHLEVIRWCRSVYDWGSAFLECARTPVLRTLRTSDFGLDFERTSAAEARFFARASRTLSTLELNWAQGIEEYTNHQHFFTPDSSVENLILSGCTRDMLVQVCSKLTPTGSITTATKSIPKLKALMVERCIVLDDNEDYVTYPVRTLEPEQFEPLLLMLERRLVGGDSFRLVFTEVMVDWTPGVQAGLRELVKKGVKLEIVEDGDVADWL